MTAICPPEPFQRPPCGAWRNGRTAGGFQREAVPRACGLRNGLSGRQGGFHLPQRGGSHHGDLKPEAAGASGLCQVPPAAFSV